MKRLALAVALAPTLLLAACGGTACSSAPAATQTTSPNCTVAAGQQVTVTVALCGKCTDSSPSCQAEWLGDHLEVAPTVEQCQEQSGCNPSGSCDINTRATCTVTIPAGTMGSPQLVLAGENTYTGTLTIGPGTTCNL
jgi:hypothetical protein